MFTIDRRSLITAMGGALIARPFATNAAPDTPPELQHNNAFSLHSSTSGAWQKKAEMLDKVPYGSIRGVGGPRPIDLEDIAVNANGLPAEIPSGATALEIGWQPAAHDPSSPMFGDFVIRHTLPETYTISSKKMTLGESSTITVDGVPMTRIEAAVTYPKLSGLVINISGPSPLPPDWDIQFLRVSDEAAYDNTALPKWHATRRFIPEYLAKLAEWQPHHFRFMKVAGTEESKYGSVADYPGVDSRANDHIWPIEVQVGLCNHIRTGGWFTLPVAAENDLIDHWCDVIISHMDPDLPVIIEHGNEHWNNVYKTNWLYSWEGLSRFGTQGAGTVSVDKATRTVTGVGTDFVSAYQTGWSAMAVNGATFPINPDTMTATSVQLRSYWPDYLFNEATDAPFYHNPLSSSLMPLEGYTVRSTLAMKRVTDKFSAAGQMHRLTRAYGAKAVGTGIAEQMLDAKQLWQGSPDYIDPLSVHDAIAVGPYFGANALKPAKGSATTSFAEYLRARATADPIDQQGYNEAMRDLMLDIPIPGIALNTRSMPAMKSYLKANRDFCDEQGFKMLSYEGGPHIIASAYLDVNNVPGDQEIVNAWPAFLQSPEAREVFEAWRDIQIPYLDGPIMRFQLFGEASKYGAYGMFQDYDPQPDDKSNEVMAEIRSRAPFWLPDYPPQAVPVPDQNWVAGRDPALDLKDFVSVNATGFSGTPPAGITLGSDGVLSGAPRSGSGSYIFTASNDAGSVAIPINITVT